ncbi:MAG: UPF0182 family protein, partial [candidate division NC10 bacterium]|nr:UPF0182 family protein [candidate division NC10 bacterium]
YTDWLWFHEIKLPFVFVKILTTRLLLAGIFGVLFFLFLYFNLRLAGRTVAADVLIELEDRFGLPSRLIIEPYFQRLLLPGTFLLGLFAAFQAGATWEDYLRFAYAVPFGITDPFVDRVGFGNDIGFYIFRLPFFVFLYRFLMLTLILTLLLTALVYFLFRGIQVGTRGPVFAPRTKAHLLILGAVILLVKAVGYHLDTYELLYSPTGVVFGAGYADVHANLPVLRALTALAALVATLSIVQIFRSGFRLVLLGLAALIVVAFLGLGIYPTLLQRFRVAPNEIAAEQPYILNNIRLTRQAYALNRIKEQEFPAEESLTLQDLKRNDLTIKNIRLWDHRPLLRTYAQLQEIRTYYKFTDVDIDRYQINGEYRQVMLSPRELSYQDLPGEKSWINQHMIYTHGYGVVMTPVNRLTKEGLPELFIKDIPPVSNVNVAVKRPEIYYGELTDGYVLVKTNRQELDFPSGDTNVYSTYAGEGGVSIGSFLRRLLFAIRFGNVNVILNRDITPESRIAYYRKIEERVKQAFPLLRYDRDPYLIIAQDGRLFWIIDAYTTSHRYPYSAPIRGVGNYIRNSVKVVIDAYNGSLAFYLADPEDPIIQAYTRAFPGLLKPLEEMPKDLQAHIRYPVDLFTIQARMFAIYHMRDPQVFYNKEDLWGIPTKVEGGREAGMEPYYMIMKLPGEEKEEFILLIPFTPTRRDNMIAWMAARADRPNYGKLVAYTFPKAKLIFGPKQIDARIDQDATISQQITLWSQAGSQVIRGNLLAIPIEKSLIYVEPLYLAATENSLPELKRVIVAFGNTLAMEETLEGALQRVFGGRIVREAAAKAEAPPSGENLKELAERAWEHYRRAQELLRQGDFAGYGEEQKQLEGVLRTLRERAGR